jgi:hypothetical protein
MKNLLTLLLMLLMISCTETATNQTTDNQQNTSLESKDETIVQEIETPTNPSKTGLFNYDKSKLVFQPAQVLPVDESKQNASLRKTLDNLLIVINNKDVDGLRPFMDNNIKLSFGEDNGFEDFITFWDLDLNPEKSMLWDVLKTTITLGGTFDRDNKNAYYTPYLHTSFIEDPFEFGVIIGEKVNIRAEPNLKGKLVRQLTHEVVQVIAYDKDNDTRTQIIGQEKHDWMKIKMADGEVGYVWGKFFRSPIDYRAGFAKVRDEGWKMIFFVAGD